MDSETLFSQYFHNAIEYYPTRTDRDEQNEVDRLLMLFFPAHYIALNESR